MTNNIWILVLGEVLIMISSVWSDTSLAKIEELVQQWAPLIWLAPNENFLPLNAEEFLENVDVVRKESLPDPDLHQPDQLPLGPGSEKYYLEPKEKIETLLENKSSFLYGRDPSKHNVSVYSVVTKCSPNLSFRVSDAASLPSTISSIYNNANQIPYFHVTYWTFYPYNEGKEACFLGKLPTPLIFGSCFGQRKKIGNHVGDWEHISLSFNGKPYPDKLYVSVHDAGVYYKYQPKSRLFKYEKQVTRKGILQRPNFPPVVRKHYGHPILFSAYGSHGMWSAPGEHYYVRVPKLIDKNGYGIIWKTWNNLKFIDLQSENIPDWVKFKGRWGNLRKNCFLTNKLGLCELFDGPPGMLERKKDFYC